MELLMNDHELLDLGKGLRGMRVECREGRCWLTQSGDSRDHILGAGDSFAVRADGRLIITATEQCRLMLVHEKNHGIQPFLLKAVSRILKDCADEMTA